MLFATTSSCAPLSLDAGKIDDVRCSIVRDKMHNWSSGTHNHPLFYAELTRIGLLNYTVHLAVVDSRSEVFYNERRQFRERFWAKNRTSRTQTSKFGSSADSCLSSSKLKSWLHSRGNNSINTRNLQLEILNVPLKTWNSRGYLKQSVRCRCTSSFNLLILSLLRLQWRHKQLQSFSVSSINGVQFRWHTCTCSF